ncbi:MAG: Ig-like domain repeat protein [Nitrospirae bacterium]|nr:Ig-like domain repeat protein [Nitrospirota bacterium]
MAVIRLSKLLKGLLVLFGFLALLVPTTSHASWSLPSTLTNSFGAGVTTAVNADGSTITVVVGDYNNNKVYVFVNGTLTATLTATGSTALGKSVAISQDGSTIVAGDSSATVGGNANQGAVYVFAKPTSGWATTTTQTAKLTASGGAASDALGGSVSVSQDGVMIVAGAISAIGGSSGTTSQAGAAYVFVKSGSVWANAIQTAKLTASDGSGSDQFGKAVSISQDGSTVVAGAPYTFIGPSNPQQGAAYVFIKPGGGWATATQTAKLTASDGSADDQSGGSVSTTQDGGIIVVGNPNVSSSGPGAAYVFVRPGSGWATATQTAKLTASDGATYDQLGKSVSISADGNAVVAGAPYAAIGNNSQQGAVYAFIKPGGGWATATESQKIYLLGGILSDQLGVSVAVSQYGSSIVAGNVGGSGPASAYVWSVTSTTTTISSSLNPSTDTDLVTFTASVGYVVTRPIRIDSPTPEISFSVTSGTITFKDGATTLCSVSISGGQATYSTSLSVGTHSITAVFGGSTSYSSSTSSALSQVVNSSGGGGGGGGGGVVSYGTSTSITSSANPSTYGTPVTISATVAGTDPNSTASGIVTFTDGSATLAAISLDGSAQASFSTSSLSVGTHPITAAYGGSSSYSSSTSSALSQVVNAATSATSVSSSLNPSTYGSSVTFTASVTGQSPTGTVTFKDGAATLGTASLNSSGQATYSTSSLSVGTHSITAGYSGDTRNSASSSGALNQAVNTVTAATTLSSSVNPSIYGSSVTFTATVTGTSPTGTVTFKDGTTTLGTASLNSGGQAAYSTSSLSPGSHSITAVYGGDTRNSTSTSAALNQAVNSVTSTTTVTSSLNPSIYGASVTFTAKVTGTSPTGTVTFKDGTTTLGTASLNSNGQATYSTSSLSAGSHSITAVYGGNTNNLSSTSGVLNQVVTSIILTSSMNPANYGVPVTFTAAVMGNSPTGTITFMAGATPVSTVALDTSGQAVLTLSSMAIGTYSMTAVYSGDSNNPASTSAVLTQIIASITVTSSVSSVAHGVPVTFTAAITGNSPTGTITFTDNMTADNTTTLGTATLFNAEASMTTAALAVGTHSITAIYSGDLKNPASTSAPYTQIVTDNTSQTVSFTIAGSGSVLVYDDSFNLVSTLKKGGYTSVPSGSVRLFYFMPTAGSVLTQITVNGKPMQPVSIIRAIMVEDYVINAVYSP